MIEMRILVTFAVEAEFAPWRKLRDLRVNKVGDIAVNQIGKAKTLQSSRRLVLAAKNDGAFHSKMFLTSDSVIRSAGEKANLAPFGDAVDMESFAILSMAREHKISAVAIRVISDTSNRDMPVFLDAVVDDMGRVKIGGLVRKV